MSNLTVPAAAEGMPKFDRAAIMRAAWENYRYLRGQYADWQIERGLVDVSFSRCLKAAWANAKKDLAEARARAAAVAAYGERAASQVQTLTLELMRIDARPWKMSTRADRSALLAEIATFRGRV